LGRRYLNGSNLSNVSDVVATLFKLKTGQNTWHLNSDEVYRGLFRTDFLMNSG
jgi:hypothetical protein